MTGNGIVLDTAQNTTSQIAHLVANNVTCVLRYLDPLSANAPKVIKPAEAQALATAGIKLALANSRGGKRRGCRAPQRRASRVYYQRDLASDIPPGTAPPNAAAGRP